jgi:hypothetical protein
MPNLMTIHQLGVIREGRGGLNMYIYIYIYKIMYIKIFFLEVNVGCKKCHLNEESHKNENAFTNRLFY